MINRPHRAPTAFSASQFSAQKNVFFSSAFLVVFLFACAFCHHHDILYVTIRALFCLGMTCTRSLPLSLRVVILLLIIHFHCLCGEESPHKPKPKGCIRWKQNFEGVKSKHLQQDCQLPDGRATCCAAVEDKDKEDRKSVV